MKRILLAATALVLTVAVKAQTSTPDDVIKLNTEKYDFGKIKHNVPVDYYFEITNKSDKPVVVENTWGSCGCTTPEKPKDPIAPGQTIKLKVNYNAAALGHFEKQVSIKLAGVDQVKVITITGETIDDAQTTTTVQTQPQVIAPQPLQTQPLPVKTKVKDTKTKTKSGTK
jgi:hypothetical protein